MGASRLPELKQKLVNEKNLGNVWSFFMDHFGENDEFMSLGQRAQPSVVEPLIVQIGKAMFGGPGVVAGLVLTRVADQKFVHGGFALDGRVGSIFYFEDIETGLMSVSAGMRSDQVKFARFSTRTVRESAPPSAN